MTLAKIARTVRLPNGLDMYYEDSGGAGMPLIMVHGLWGSARFFHKQFRDLSPSYRVVAVDLRGAGRSSMTLSSQTVPTYAADLRQFIQHLGLSEYVAVGWSMGAFVWWEMFSQVGANGMKGLVVIDQPPTDIQSPDFPNALISLEGLAQWCQQVQTERNNFVGSIIPMLFAETLAPEDFEWMFDELTRPPGVVAAATLMDMSLRDYRETLKGYPIPTLVCRGAKSPEPAEGADMIVAAVRQARVHVFEHSAHSPFLEEADEFNRVVADFVESL